MILTACVAETPSKPSDETLQRLRKAVIDARCTATDSQMIAGLGDAIPAGGYADLEPIIIVAMFEGWFAYDDDEDAGTVYSAACNNTTENPYSITMRAFGESGCQLEGREDIEAFLEVMKSKTSRLDKVTSWAKNWRDRVWSPLTERT